jgi:hypothetical protein
MFEARPPSWPALTGIIARFVERLLEAAVSTPYLLGAVGVPNH